MKRVSNLLTLVVLLFIFTSNSYAQVVGQIFTKEEAKSRYGAVKESVTFPRRNLEIILNKADEYVMFNIIEKQLYILNSKREVLYPTGGSVNEDQVFYYFSKSVVEGLINFFEKKDNVQVELRKEVLSITYGAFTLELMALCPPVCP